MRTDIAGANKLMKDGESVKDQMREETKSAAKTDASAFDFGSKIDDKKWGFNTNKDAMAFMVGQLCVAVVGSNASSPRVARSEYGAYPYFFFTELKGTI